MPNYSTVHHIIGSPPKGQCSEPIKDLPLPSRLELGCSFQIIWTNQNQLFYYLMRNFGYLICAKIEGNLSAIICICFRSTRTSFQNMRQKHMCLFVGKY